jgi:hypothetical protein
MNESKTRTVARAPSTSTLIAAAPELYEALARLISPEQDAQMEENPGDFSEDWLAARAILAKARGETMTCPKCGASIQRPASGIARCVCSTIFTAALPTYESKTISCGDPNCALCYPIAARRDALDASGKLIKMMLVGIIEELVEAMLMIMAPPEPAPPVTAEMLAEVDRKINEAFMVPERYLMVGNPSRQARLFRYQEALRKWRVIESLQHRASIDAPVAALGADPDGPLVPLPAQPLPPEERPFVPSRWIGGDR